MILAVWLDYINDYEDIHDSPRLHRSHDELHPEEPFFYQISTRNKCLHLGTSGSMEASRTANSVQSCPTDPVFSYRSTSLERLDWMAYVAVLGSDEQADGVSDQAYKLTAGLRKEYELVRCRRGALCAEYIHKTWPIDGCVRSHL